MKPDLKDPITDLWWFLGILGLIWLVWFATGGPEHYEATHGVFLKPPSPLSSGETYGNPPSIKLKLPDTLNVFLAGKRAVLGAKTNLRAGNPDKEYLEIVGAGDSPVDITGWRIVGQKGINATIPQGVRVFLAGQVNEEKDIYLDQGHRAVIISGVSPVGVSFRVNACSGYLSQFQDFVPELNEVCPAPSSSPTVKDFPLDSACLDYLNSMPLCQTPTKTLPSKLSAACHEFILLHASYNACLSDHQSDKDFWSGEWRVYLGQSEELFGDHDTIKFYDKDNKFIGTYVY